MKRINIFLTSVALSLFVLFPAAAHADDDELDVTMDVLDSIADLDGDVIVMEGPEHDDFDYDEDEDESDGHEGDAVADHDESDHETDHESDRVGDDFMDEQEDENHDFLADASDDGFAHDDDFESDEDEEHSEGESDFDVGDDVDTDEHDEEPMDGDDSMHDEEFVDGEPTDVASENDMVDEIAEAESDLQNDVAGNDSA